MGFGISFFKVPKHRQFDYKPRFYDPEKERREKRKIELGLGGESDEDVEEGLPGSIIRSGAMRKRHEMYSQKMAQQKRQTLLLRVLLVVALIAAAAYILSDYKEELVEVLFNR